MSVSIGGKLSLYRATNTRLQREVAIKVLPAERMAGGERKARFIQEARGFGAESSEHCHL